MTTLPPIPPMEEELIDPEDPGGIALAASVNPALPPLEELAGEIQEEEGELLNDEELRDALISIFNIIEKEEQPARENLVKTWKYYDLLWEGIQPIFWNAVDREWQLIDKMIKLPNNIVIDPLTFNKSLNIIRSYGESISGAITTGLPKVNYFPDNADQIDDIKTSKAYSKIERIIAEHNMMELGLLKLAMTYWRFGFVAVYNYSHESEDYGIDEKPITEEVPYVNIEKLCPNCAGQLGSEQVTPEEYKVKMDSKTDLNAGADLNAEILERMLCETCGTEVPPLEGATPISLTEQVGMDITPRSRQVIEIYSPLEVKIPANARNRGQIYSVILEEEIHYSQLRHKFPDYFDKINGGEGNSSSSYERWARSNYELDGGTLENLTTMDRIWLKPDAFCVLDKETSDKLNKMYPKGVYYAVINDDVCEIKGESFDDCWTFSESPGDRRLLAVPPAKNVVPIQELTNEIMSLEVKCLRHSIGTTFINPEVFSFEAYRKTRKEPGQIHPMGMSAAGGKLADNIAELRTAVLPKEAQDLDAKLEKMGQFLSGAFPSVFGGEAGGSKTAFEYKESRNNALQRLGIVWKIISNIYAQMMHRCIKGFINHMKDDAFYSVKQGNSYINVWIQKAELQGKIGRVAPEVSEQFPTSWAQKRAILLDLMEMQNEMINAVIFHPENLGLLSQLIGIEDMYIPGDNDRNKQLEEIRTLITSEPIMTGAIDPVTGQPQMTPSVPTEPMLDNGNVHIETMKAFACSDVGLYVKENNPMGWANFMAHLQEHMMYMAEQIAQENAAIAAEEGAAEDAPTGGEA